MQRRVRRSYGRAVAFDGRVTLVGVIVAIVLYTCGFAVSTAAWRAIVGCEPPAALGALLSAGALGLWLAPLVLWVADAARGDGALRWARLKASAALVLSWGGGLGLLLPLAHGADTPAQRAAAVIAGAVCSYVGVRLLDSVAVRHAGLGFVGAAVAGVAGWQALAPLTAFVHRAHLAGHLAAVRADRLPLWIALGSLATGALITATLHVRSGSRAVARPARKHPPVQDLAVDPHRALTDAQMEFLKRAGHGPETQRLYLLKRAQDAERGRDAERAVAAAIVELATRGWSLQASLFLPGERFGDIDILATGPSGRHYAIDVKSTDCRVEYDAARRELVLRYGQRSWSPRLLEAAQRQALGLARHGYGQVQPVLCFTRAAIVCGPVVDGVAVIASDTLLAWLETTDPQARTSGGTPSSTTDAPVRRRSYRTVLARRASRRHGE